MSERLSLRTESDVATAARAARELATTAGLGATDAVGVATAVSEIGMNVLLHGGGDGVVELELVHTPERRGIAIVVRDSGPGIADPWRALQDGFSTGTGLGLGLPGARRLMDDLSLTTQAGEGTEVRMAKWAVGAGPLAIAQWTVERGAAEETTDALVERFSAGLLAAALHARGPARAAAASTAAARELLRADPGATPIELAERCAAATAPGATLALALASQSALDGRLVWLSTADATATLSGGAAAPVNAALTPRTTGGLRAATVALTRGDELTLRAGDARVVLQVLRGRLERRGGGSA